MAYWKDIWKFPDSIEYEYKFAGNYGAKGEKRAKKKKATKEQIEKQNQQNREKRMRRLLKENFSSGDLWCTFKYPAGTRKTIEEVDKDRKNFLDATRRAYTKMGQPFKFVYRIEIGAKGGIHIHMVINRLDGNTDLLIQEKWSHGRVNFENIYESGGFKNLAEYIVKQPDEEQNKQLSLFPEKERKKLIKTGSSRNLVRPEPERKKYTRRTMRKIIEEGPKPTPGYYIDKDSIIQGVNPYTGMSYLYYIEYRLISQRERERRERLCKR